MADQTPGQPRPVRERILDAATDAFYREGIRAVSADKIIAAAGTTKVTFYRYFPTKDELVAAYLAAKQERAEVAAAFDAAVRGPSPDVTGGYRYLGLDRMSYYVNKDAYRAQLEAHLARLAAPAGASVPAPAEVNR